MWYYYISAAQKYLQVGQSQVVEEETDALALSNVGGIFIVLLVGIGLAYIIALFEFLWNVRQLSIEEQVRKISKLS